MEPKRKISLPRNTNLVGLVGACGAFIALAFLLRNHQMPSDTLLTKQQVVYNATMQEFHAAIHTLTKELEMVQTLKDSLGSATASLKETHAQLMSSKKELKELMSKESTTGGADEAGHNELHTWIKSYTKGPGVHKWTPYLDAYHRHFNRFRTQEKITVVEVGVQSGGSIEMWRAYFGEEKLNYIGVDINPATKKFEKEDVRIVIGNQDQIDFWTMFKEDFPNKIDIFIDDGGHTMTQQLVTLEQMFWHVRDGGIYLCEDLHTSYWPDSSGGYLKEGTMIEKSKALVDTIHAWHSKDPDLQVDDWTRNIRGLHFYDSMVFIDKLMTDEMDQYRQGDEWIPYSR